MSEKNRDSLSFDGKQYVRDLKDKDLVESIFLVQEKMELTDRNGRTYLSVNLSDISGVIDGKIWEKVENFSQAFQVGDFLLIKGRVQLYQNRKQLVILDLAKADYSSINLKDFVNGSSSKPGEMYDELLQLTASIQDRFIKQLIESTLTDEMIKNQILISPAAKTIHHATIGGLLEHILSICKLMEGLCLHYPFLNRDYLIFGAIFHDLGKVMELEVGVGIQYTDMGRLVGHMAICCQIIDEKAGRILGFPAQLKNELKHIVLSHHGKLEYGSPKRPKFLEAMVVAMVDDLDSKINTMFGVLKSELDQSEKWSRYNQHFDRYLYLDILKRKLQEKEI